jgi:hypothetical protein
MLPSENSKKPDTPDAKKTYVMTLMISVTDETALKAAAATAAAEGDLSAEEWADLRFGVPCDLSSTRSSAQAIGLITSNAAAGSCLSSRGSIPVRCNQLHRAGSPLDWKHGSRPDDIRHFFMENAG